MATLCPRFAKDPDATLDYAVDWTPFLNGDTISTSTWTVPAGLTSVSESNTTEIATVFLAGGVVGASYSVLNRIVTSSGVTDDRSIIIQILNK